jgi:hypothetical protein
MLAVDQVLMNVHLANKGNSSPCRMGPLGLSLPSDAIEVPWAQALIATATDGSRPLRNHVHARPARDRSGYILPGATKTAVELRIYSANSMTSRDSN